MPSARAGFTGSAMSGPATTTASLTVTPPAVGLVGAATAGPEVASGSFAVIPPLIVAGWSSIAYVADDDDPFGGVDPTQTTTLN